MMKCAQLFLLFASVSLSSCIQEEAPNAECDIQQVMLRVNNPGDFFYSQADSLQAVSSADSVINIEVKLSSDISALSPEFVITESATITPSNGSVQDFSNGGVRYTVRSADKRWSRDYLMKVIPVRSEHISDSLIAVPFSFEQFDLEPSNNKYYYWLEEGNNAYWATGNPGFGLSRPSAKPDEYPTTPYAHGLMGSAVKLTTKSTGTLGATVNMRLAAGNLFIGAFDVSSALKDALLATSFGKPFTQAPVRLKGYYKYTPGENYQDRAGKIIPGKVDRPDIYAVFYRNTDDAGNNVVLNGTNILTSPYVVAVAQLQNPEAPTEWKEFNLPFVYRDTNIDLDRLSSRGYSLTIVLSSSVDGAIFCGALESTLIVDELTLICNKDEE